MAACFARVRDKIRSNGGLSNVNWQDAEDPQNLVDEFHSLYSEKLKEIEKEFPESLEPKCQALTELVSDLSEQNNMLLKTVEELEKEAITQIDTFSSIAVAARDTVQQDVKSDLKQLLELMRRLREEKRLCACGLSFKTIRYEDIFGEQPIISPNAIECCEDYCYYQYGGDAICTKSDLPKFSRYQRRYRPQRKGAEDSTSFQVENNKVLELQEALKENENHLATCMLEVERLTSCMSEKDLELCKLKKTQERMGELERTVNVLESDLTDRASLVESLQADNEKVKVAALNIDERLEDVNQQLLILKEELKQKDALLDKYKSQSSNAKEEAASNTDERLEDVNQQLLILKEELKQKDALLDKYKSQSSNAKEEAASNTDERLEDVNQQLLILKEELKQKDALLDKYKSQSSNAKEEAASNTDERLEDVNQQLLILKEELKQKDALLDKYKSQSSNAKETKDALVSEQQRVERLKQQVAHLETALLTRRMSSSGDIHRVSLLSHEIENLRDQLKQKNDEISKCKEKEDNLKFQLSQTNNSVKDLEKEWKDKALKYERELEKRKSLSYDQKNLHKDITTTNKPNFIDVGTNNTSNREMLEFKLKDMQEALTGEIADQHDEIRRLKDDVKELEEKLLHSDKQTQFKDDIIKELRKEVKIGRAKESLAEMLGLKGTPRAAMKTRIDYLTCQLEEMRTHVVSLEGRLGECNLPAVISLKSRLNSAEGSLLAMCNKMDYVRKYLENLKGDEELSIKCGLEALLSELREDVEWNRQTRRNLSLDEGTSVIVISHRSHSLPDNSFYRLVSKTKSDSAVITASRQPSLHSKHSLESFEGCSNYIEVINELESYFEETCKNLNSLWNEFQSYTKGNGDGLLNEMNNILMSFDISKTAVTEIVNQMENTNYYKGNGMLYYHLHCLKGNLQEISESLSKVHLISSSSELSFHLEAGDTGVKQKLSTAIDDSLSIVQVIENMKNSDNMQYEENSTLVESSVPDIILLFKSVLEEKDKFLKKIATVQRQQFEFSQTLVKKMMEFEKGFCNYNSSAECLKKETRKLFAIILAKEKQLQKQSDEIDNLKLALSSNKYVEEAGEEIYSLRKVVSNKDLQLDENQDLINDLEHLNNSIQKSLSHSSPSLYLMAESHENLFDESHQLEEGVLSLKEKWSTVSEELMRSKAKMHRLGEETRSLVEAVTKIQEELPTPKESTTEDLDLSRLSTSINEAENKGEELLQALESFIFEDQSDFQDLTDSVNDHIDSLLDITQNIKRSSENGRLSMKSIKDENNTMKQQLSKLLNRLTLPSSRKTETYDTLPLGSKDHENEQSGAHGKDDFTKSLKKGLSRSDPYLEKMQARTSLAKGRAEGIAPGSSVGLHVLRRSEGRAAAAGHHHAAGGHHERDAQRVAEAIAQGSPVGQRERDAQRRAEGISQDSPAKRRAEAYAQQVALFGQQEWDARRGAEGITQGSPVGQREWGAQQRAESIAHDSYLEQQEWNTNVPFHQDSYGIEPYSSEEHAIEEADDEKDYIFQSLQNNLCRSNCYLRKMQQEYTSLKLEKAEMEERTQKVMEELQAKVCKLQAALQNQEPEANFLYQLRCIIEQQSQKSEEAKQYIGELQEKDLENQWEIKTLKNELNTLECRHAELQVKFEEAKECIITLHEKLSEKELEELQITRKMSNPSLNSQLQELMELKEKVACWENLMLLLKKEIANRSDQAEHWLSVSNKQKENLTNLITENHLLKAENDTLVNEKTQLLHDLETKRKELCELTEALVNTRYTMMKLNQEKVIQEHINCDLQKVLREKQILVCECGTAIDKKILQDQEDFIEVLILKITQMNSFLNDRDETIDILQNHLQMSTMLMLDNVDGEDNKNDFCSSLDDVMDQNIAKRAAVYKMKLWQSLEANRRLVSMIDSLQRINYSLLQEKCYTNEVEESLPVEQYESNGLQ